jgi:hypothetical protein
MSTISATIRQARSRPAEPDPASAAVILPDLAGAGWHHHPSAGSTAGTSGTTI